jgi:transaldolase
MPAATEVDLAWAIVDEMSAEAAQLLMPAFEKYGGRQGRLSMQTNPQLWRSFEQMLEQGVAFTRVAPNIIVKFPATKTGIAVMEEATYRGVSINATVSFSVAQAVAAAEAVERGLERRDAEGLPTDDMGPVITIMVGRVEDWLKLLVDRDGTIVHPAALAYSGVAVFKRAYEIFRERGFRARLLSAAIRHHLHWSEFVGGDVVITLPGAWQKKFNASSVEVRERMDDAVDPSYIAELSAAFPDFVKAYEPDGLTIDEFDSFAPTVRTLRAFIGSYHELLTAVTDAQLPNPDVKR